MHFWIALDKYIEKNLSRISRFDKNQNLIQINYFFNDKSFNQDATISTKTLTQYNNIAYYLEKAGAYKESIYLLEKIIEKYPNRIVAYINLGDAYLGNKQKTKAIKAYKKYIELMKKTGKEKKIPKRVLELVNDSKTLAKNQSQTTSQKEEKTFFSKLLQWFGISQHNKNTSLMYS